jgi:ABC-type transport system involved in cytochrome c biogenesis permease component
VRSGWVAEAAAVFAKDWRSERRARHAVATLLLFAVTTLVIASLALGPVGASRQERTDVTAALVWIILLFAAAAGLPRAFVHEEESRTASALRLAARPSAVLAGKLAWVASPRRPPCSPPSSPRAAALRRFSPPSPSRCSSPSQCSPWV